jgi:hypothetical protein
MPTIDIDSQTAHDAAASELAKPIYPKASLTTRIVEWFNELLHRLMAGAADLPGGWLALVAVGLLAAAAVVVAVRVARRTMGRRGDRGLYGKGTESAADHRENAESAAGRKDWAAAIRHRVRAIGRQLEQDGVLRPVTGRTAGELARDAGTARPDLAAEIATAAELFNDVTYGEQPGSEPQYRLVADLDDRLRAMATTAAAGSR